MSNAIVPVANNALASQASSVANTSLLSSDGSSATSLFLNFMSMFGQSQGLQANTLYGNGFQNASSNSLNAANAQSSLNTFGKSGFNFDPALLVLPAGMANLSEEELQKFLTGQVSENANGLNHGLLLSLTAGIPTNGNASLNNLQINPADKNAVDLAALSALKDNAASNALSLDNALSINTAQSMSGDPLLAASGLSPAQIEQMKAQLAATAKANKDAQDMSNASNLAFVTFVPVTIQSNAVNSGEFDFSGLTAAGKDKFTNQSSSRVMSFDMAKTGETRLSAAEAAEQSMSPIGMAGLVKTGKSTATPTDAQTIGNTVDGSTAKDDTNGSLSSQNFGAFFLNSGIGQSGLDSSLLPLSANGLLNSHQAANALTTPVLNNPSAISGHPATHTIAATIEKASKNESKEQILSIQLDPPELGRVQIQLSYEKGEPMKVHVLTEKKDTFNMLQRDSHALQSALDQAGIQMNGSSLTFDMAGGDQNFNQMLGQFQDDSSQKQGNRFSLEGSSGSQSSVTEIAMNVRMNDIPDFSNGSYNFYA